MTPTPKESSPDMKQCCCIEHNNGGEKVMVVNDCPVHDELFGKNAVPQAIAPTGDGWEKEDFLKADDEFDKEFIDFYFQYETFESNRLVLLPEDVKGWVRHLLSRTRQETYEEALNDLVKEIDNNTLVSDLYGWKQIVSMSKDRVLKRELKHRAGEMK